MHATGRYPIPGRTNFVLMALQICAVLAILSICSRAISTPVFIVAMLSFPFAAQLGFCLTHESIHNKLHSNAALNDAAGSLLMVFFPGSYHFLKIAHLTHHRRNRSDAELEDYILPGENAFLKRLQYYALISGLFWLLVPLCSFVLALVPKRQINLRSGRPDAPMWLRFGEFVNDVDLDRVRVEVLISASIWTIASMSLHLKASAIVACYVAFAFSWASQQYIYHVRTPLDVVEGALDLRLWRPMELLYLNFNYHLTHHRAVSVPWVYLRGTVEESPTRTYFRTYLELWRPPQPLVREISTAPTVMTRRQETETRPATAADNEGLLALTRDTPMPGSVTLRIDRGTDFFRLVQLRGESTVFVATRGGRVIGCISAARRKQFVSGEIRDVTYLGDLKIHRAFSGGRVALQLVSSAKDTLRRAGSDLFMTVISHGNTRTMSLLERRLGLPGWRALGTFCVSEILPSPFPVRTRFAIREATNADAPEIARLVNQLHRQREFAPVVALDDLHPTEERLPMVATEGGEIVATLTIFDVNAAKQNVVTNASLPIRLSLRLLRFGELLFNSYRAPRFGSPIRLLYLRWLAHAPGHEDALRALVHFARHQAYQRHYSFVVAGFHERDPLQRIVSAIPRLTFRSAAYAVSLTGQVDLEKIATGIPFQDYALV